MRATVWSEEGRRRRRGGHIAIVLLVWASVLVGTILTAPSVRADDTQCVGAITGPHENVVVPPGAICTITAATVTGNVTALENSILSIQSSTILGNVEGVGADQVEVLDSTVRENIWITGGSDLAGEFFASVCGSIVEEGNIHVEGWRGRVNLGGGVLPFVCPAGRSLSQGADVLTGNITVQDSLFSGATFGGSAFDELFIQNNVVAENLQVFKNTGAGGKTVNANTIMTGTIYCKENTALLFVGGPNVGRADEAQDNQCTAIPAP